MTDQWAQTIAEEIDDHGNGLTDWERDFIESILRQLDRGRTLTERQVEVLGRIHDEKVEGRR